jgi:predicted RNase H-like nuclease (RuvC/YqgF family)
MATKYRVISKWEDLPESARGDWKKSFFEWGASVLLEDDEVVFADGGMEPEDATLGRDIGRFVGMLQRASKAIEALELRVNELEDNKASLESEICNILADYAMLEVESAEALAKKDEQIYALNQHILAANRLNAELSIRYAPRVESAHGGIL